MKVVIVSATDKEILQVKQSINPIFALESSRIQVSFHTTGVGILSSCFSIAKLIFTRKPDLLIQAGIAGTFNTETPLGKVVVIKEESLADTGVEENSQFKDLFDLDFQVDHFPFSNKKLVNPSLVNLNKLRLDEVTGITINEVTTRPERIKQLQAKYTPETESMEGASLHYCSLQTSTPFIQIRAISNYIGERDKSKWNFKNSIGNLTTTVLRYLDQL